MSAEIGVRAKVVAAFFDKEAVVKAMDRATALALVKAGAFVMRAARKRIRKAGKKNVVSRAGESPRGHTDTLRNNIFFAYDAAHKRVLIGPVKLGGKIGSAPDALELGGQSARRRTKINGARVVERITIQKRPYMGPALAAEAPKFPSFFADQAR